MTTTRSIRGSPTSRAARRPIRTSSRRCAGGDGKQVLVILDSDHSQGHVEAELEAYAPLVPVGCYLIVEDSNIGQIRKDLMPGPARGDRDVSRRDRRVRDRPRSREVPHHVQPERVPAPRECPRGAQGRARRAPSTCSGTQRARRPPAAVRPDTQVGVDGDPQGPARRSQACPRPTSPALEARGHPRARDPDSPSWRVLHSNRSADDQEWSFDSPTGSAHGRASAEPPYRPPGLQVLVGTRGSRAVATKPRFLAAPRLGGPAGIVQAVARAPRGCSARTSLTGPAVDRLGLTDLASGTSAGSSGSPTRWRSSARSGASGADLRPVRPAIL